MKVTALNLLVIGLAVSPIAYGESYIPLSQSADPQYRGKAITARAEHRPVLPGVRPVEVELVEDLLRRKMPKKVGDSRLLAHQKVLSIDLRDPAKSGQFRGLMAEAMFLEKNPDWGYVSKPNAPQVDVYLRREGMRPIGAQIKIHRSGNPATYARDMIKDTEANLFMVPDDHVTALRQYLRAQIDSHERTGNTLGASEARQRYSRVRSLGFSYSDTELSLVRVQASMRREHYAGYVSLGTAFGLARGIMAFSFADHETLSDMPKTIGHGAAVIGAERLATKMMVSNAQRISSTPAARPNGLRFNPVRGTIFGEAIVGAAILMVDSGFTIYEGGGLQSLHSPNFYSDITLSAMSLAAGTSVGSLALEAGPFVAVAAAAAASTAVYVGFQKPTHQVIALVFKDRVRKTDDAIYNATKAGLDQQVSELQTQEKRIALGS